MSTRKTPEAIEVVKHLIAHCQDQEAELSRLRAELHRADIALSESPFHGQEELAEASLADGIRHYRSAVEAELARLRAENERLVEALSSPELLETLAALEHERWSGWMKYQAEKIGTKHPTTGEQFEVRWKRQSETVYSDLPERERESDRVEARKTLTAIRAALSRAEQAKPETCVWVRNPYKHIWVTGCGYQRVYPDSPDGCACVVCGKKVEVRQ